MVSSSGVAMPFSLTSGIRRGRMGVCEVIFSNIPLLIVGGKGIWGLSVLASVLVSCLVESRESRLGLNATLAFQVAGAMCVNPVKESGDLRHE